MFENITGFYTILQVMKLFTVLALVLLVVFIYIDPYK
jgi:hypothetical protein